MHIEQLTEPVATHGVGPVFLSELKEHLRIDHSDLDAELGSLSLSAARAVEHSAGLSLLSRSVAIWFDQWPTSDRADQDWWNGVVEGALSTLHEPARRLFLPVRPISNVVTIETFDEDGTAALWAAGQYHFQPGLDPHLVRLSSAWPRPGRVADGIRIEVEAGFGSHPNQIPADLTEAIKLLTGYFFMHRGEAMAPGSASLPPMVRTLIAPYKRRRV